MNKQLCRLMAVTILITVFPGIAGRAVSATESERVEVSSDQDSIPIHHLGEVIVVTGKRDAPKGSVSEITSLDMSATGTNTVRSALNSVTGVVVTTGSKGESRLQIRGFQGRETLVLLDGRPINLPYYGETDLNMIPISNISKAKVVKGPAAAVYGANTLGGLVNLVSKRTRTNSRRELNISVGENDSYDVQCNYGVVHHGFDSWVSLGYATSSGWNLSRDFEPTEREDGDLRDSSSYRSFNLDGKMNYTLHNGTVLSLSAGYYDSRRAVPVATEIDRARYDRFPDWRRHYVDISGQGLFGDRLSWYAKLYYDVARNRLIRYQDNAYSEDNIKFNSFHDSFDVGTRLLVTYQISEKLDNTFGTTLRVDGIDRQEDTGADWVYSDALSGSLFSQFLFNPSDEWSVEAGVSYNRNQADAVNASTGSVDPYLGAGFSPREWLEIHTAASRATRFPTLNHLYATVSGNPDLKPEQATKLEVGYEVTLQNGLSFRQDYFNNDITDLIDRVDRDSLYLNFAEVTLRGLETGLSLSGRAGASGSVSFTYLDAYDKDPRTRRYYVPRWKADYSLSYRSELGVEINYSGQYVADRVDSYQNAMPDYYLAHVKVSYDATAYVKLYVNVRNILDRNYQEERYFPMPGRRVFFGLESRF